MIQITISRFVFRATVALLSLTMFVLATATTRAQKPAPTQGTNPASERGITLSGDAPKPAATQSAGQTGVVEKPELVLQTGYQFFGALGVAFSPDNRLLATTTFNSNAVKLWETATGRELRTLAGSAGAGAGYGSMLSGVS
ncbi:MAG: hypothetical protein LC742_01745, partial [Acidobacteria bacterium]|nr:hypothetical protein [Acidobacteriota bacterium]